MNGEVRGLEPYRARLKELDEQLLSGLGERFALCREIAVYKHEQGIAMMQPDQVRQVRERYLHGGRANRLPDEFAEALFELLIGATCKLEDELIAAAAELVANGRRIVP